jgi:hypothetical protein
MTGWRVGAAIAVGLAAISAVPVVIAYLSGYDVELVYRSAVGIGVNSVAVGYIVGWPVFEYVSRDLERLVPLLNTETAVQARQELARTYSNRGVTIARAIGIAYGVVASAQVLIDVARGQTGATLYLWVPLLVPVLWATILPALWRLLRVTWFVYRLGGQVRIDLGDPRGLGIFADVGLRHLLLIVIGLSVIPMQAILTGGLGLIDFLPPLIVTVPVAVIVLALPMWGIHRAIVTAKDAELERATAAMRDAAADSDRHLLWWLYRQHIAQSPDWPVAARSATRIALYVVIPPLAWVGAALVQDAVANVLGLH